MPQNIDRRSFSRRRVTLAVFLGLAGLASVGLLLRPTTQPGASLGLYAANLALLVAGLALLWKDRGLAGAGLGLRGWGLSALLFALFWAVISLLDLGLGAAARHFDWQWTHNPVLAHAGGGSVPAWRMIELWLLLGLGEEVAFRGYLHNKLIVLTGSRWKGMALAALLFGLWHVPTALRQPSGPLSLVTLPLFFTLFGLLALHLPYEWSGLLPLAALFNGWNDFPMLLTGREAAQPVVYLGWALFLGLAWLAGRALRRPAERPSFSWGVG